MIKALNIAALFAVTAYLVTLFACVSYPAHFGEHKYRRTYLDNDSVAVSACKVYGCGATDTFYKKPQLWTKKH